MQMGIEKIIPVIFILAVISQFFLFSKDDWLSSKLKSITADIQNLPRSGVFCDVPHRGKTKKCKKKITASV